MNENKSALNKKVRISLKEIQSVGLDVSEEDFLNYLQSDLEPSNEYDCHFQYTLVLETEGESLEDAFNKLDMIFNNDIISSLENIMMCGIDYDRDNMSGQKLSNNVYEFNLLWSGFWMIDADSKLLAKVEASIILAEAIIKMVDEGKFLRVSDKIKFKSIKDPAITDILLY